MIVYDFNMQKFREQHLIIYDFLVLLRYLSNGFFFFERCNLITTTVYAYELNNARNAYLFAYIIAVMKLNFSK